MRTRYIPYLVVAAAALVAGCAGGYDRELLGDPEPVAVAPVETQETWSDSEVSDTTGYEPLIHTPQDYDMFGDLDPYGAWYQTDAFGAVYRPAVPVDWQPYERGHWIWTSYGWMWASYDPFGWATYHYGTWWFDAVLGWIWIPDYSWSPCPVDWIVAGDYCGWAPLPPAGCSWDDPWVDQGRYKNGWVVVPKSKFKEVDVGENHVPPARFKSEYRIGTAERKAPDTRVIERATRQSVSETDIRFESQRFGNHELRKVILPSREQQIVNRFPATTPPPMSTTQTQIIAPVNPGGGGAQVTPPPGGKSKAPAPPAKGTSPEKFKSRGGDSKGSSEKAKGDSKDGEKKDDKKDDSKDGGSPSKAKGGKR